MKIKKNLSKREILDTSYKYIYIYIYIIFVCRGLDTQTHTKEVSILILQFLMGNTRSIPAKVKNKENVVHALTSLN